MKVILIVPDEGYSDRTWWRLFWSYLMKVILIVPDEGYSRNTFNLYQLQVLFQYYVHSKKLELERIYNVITALN